MSAFVIDTHALIWQSFAPVRLGAAALRVLEAAERGEVLVNVPAVVVAEALMVGQKGRVPGVTLERIERLVELLQHSPGYRLNNLMLERILASSRLLNIPDIFDRLIATEARALGSPLITRDPVFTQSGYVKTIWD